MNNGIDDILIVKYVSGEASETELRQVLEWSAMSDANAEELRKITAYWNSKVEHHADTSKGYGILCRKIRRLGFREAVLNRYVQIAAALAAGLFSGYMFFYQTGNLDTVTYMTGESVSSFVLPDKTEVTLNRNSSVSFLSDFGRSSRKVTLVGEGYFRVRHDAEKRFEVDMDGTSVTVLGTVFDAENRPGDSTVRVSLVNGSVLFKADSQNIRLTPNRMLCYNRDSEEISVRQFDPDLTTSWKDNLIRYKSTGMRALIQMLAEEKGADVFIHDDVFADDDIVSGTLESTQSFEQMLEVLSAQVHFRWEKDSDRYSILR